MITTRQTTFYLLSSRNITLPDAALSMKMPFKPYLALIYNTTDREWLYCVISRAHANFRRGEGSCSVLHFVECIQQLECETPTAKMPLGWERVNVRRSAPNKNIVFIKARPGPDEGTSKDFLERLAAQCLPIMNKHCLAVLSLEEYQPNLEFWGVI